MTSQLAALVILIVTAVAARAQTPTVTTLAVQSEGSAVTTVPAGTVVTLVAQITVTGSLLKKGQITFCEAAATVCGTGQNPGMAQLTASGTAMLTLLPGPGMRSYKAVFSGTTSYASSTSSVQELSVTAAIGTDVVPSYTGADASFGVCTGDERVYIQSLVSVLERGEVMGVGVSAGSAFLVQHAA